jgi:putative SOS response-associated peptidase YedK
MCGRYTLTLQANDLEQKFGVSFPDAARGGRYNVAPTEDIIAVARGRDDDRPTGKVMTWGLWGKPVINARSESILERPSFRKLADLPTSRCLILADGFYEWLKAEDRKQPRQPFRFTVDGGEPFAFAGLCSRGTATILTTAPNPLVARLHDRMPVILGDPETQQAWLDPDAKAEQVLELCVPFDADRMESAPVSRQVNKADPDNDGPHLLEPDADEPEREPRLFA